jgi:hypothetical protein
MNRKQWRDNKNRKHRINERRREFICLLKRSPLFLARLAEGMKEMDALRNWSI